MKAKVGIVVLTLAAITALIMIGKELKTMDTVCINEVRSTTASKDRDGYFGSDYIELYNGANETISLEGWYISDDETNLLKCKMPDIEISADGFVVLYADGGTGKETNSLNFRISSAGEKIFLSNSAGELIDSVVLPEMKYGESYSREEDGMKEWVIKEESYLKSNVLAEEILDCKLEMPIFSHESGFYEDGFELELSCNWGEVIYYTLDGRIPTKESLEYKGPITVENISEQPNVIKAVRNVVTGWKDWYPDTEPVDKAVVVRAISVDKKNRVSEVVTKTYFVGLEEYRDANIISVVAEYNDLFGENGIFVTGKKYDEQYLAGVEEEELPVPNFVQRGRPWEIVGNLQFFSSGDEICNQVSGIRTYGGSSRQGKIKRMSFYARNEYDGNEYFDGITLGERKIHAMGTNSSIGNLIFPQLVIDRAVAVQGIERTKVFLNGEYYSNTDLIEKYSKQYFEQRFGVSGDNILVIKDGEVSEGPEEYNLLYKWLQKQTSTQDLSIPKYYDEVAQLMDIQSYIDFICANVYLCNMDVSQVKNYMLWRSIENDGTEYGDGRFRWMIYDMGALDDQISHDYYQVESSAEVNSFTTKGRYVGQSISEHDIYQALKGNPSYCKQFVLSFMDMANVNFAIENVNKVFQEYGYSADVYGDFFEKRFDYIVPYMAEEFGLSGTLEEVTLKVNDAAGGTIKLNTTTPDVSEGSWSGKYYTDYPVTVTAIPAEGYEFVGWSRSITSDSAIIEVEVVAGGITLEAVFEKIAN